MTADAAAGADASEDASSADGFSGETDRFREDCGLPRAFLKNWTVGFGAVEPEASASDIMSSGRRYSKTGRAQDGKQAMGNASRTQEPFASIANPHLRQPVREPPAARSPCMLALMTFPWSSRQAFLSSGLYVGWLELAQHPLQKTSYLTPPSRSISPRPSFYKTAAHLHMIERCTN